MKINVKTKKLLLFMSAYAFYFFVSWLQLTAGNVVLQGSGGFDSVTSYDYVMPAINSAALLLTLFAFTLAGFFAYDRDKVKMLRFPMAYCISATFGAFLTDFFAALNRVITNYTDIHFNLVEINAYLIVALRFIAAVLLFIYFAKEKDEDYYSYSDQYYVENPSSKTLREKILTHRLCVLWTVLIISEGAGIAGGVLRTGLTSALMLVPDDLLWLGSCIEPVVSLVTFAVLFVLAMYFTKSFRTTVKFIGIICFADSIIDVFDFATGYINNVFNAVADSLINSVFSVISVYLFTTLLAVIRLILIVLICSKLRKQQHD